MRAELLDHFYVLIDRLRARQNGYQYLLNDAFVAMSPTVAVITPRKSVLYCGLLKKKVMVTAAEKSILRSKVAEAFDEFISWFSSFDEGHVNAIPFPGSWTPAQVASHIILATDGVPDRKTAASARPFDAHLPAIRPWWEDLNRKFQSPAELRPGDEPRAKAQLLSELHRVREKDLAIIQEKDLTAVCMDFELPTIGYLTRYEWLWFIEMHLRRHCFQLRRMLMRVEGSGR